MNSTTEINAQITHNDQDSLSNNQYLSFLLGNEPFAIAVIEIIEIIEYNNLTIVPTAPPKYCGVVNLRGKIIPIIDLTKVFGIKQSEITKRTCIIMMEIILDDEKTTIGCLVDKVLIVQEILEESIEGAPELGTVISSEYVKGLSNVEGKFITILNTDRIFSKSELIIAPDTGQNTTKVHNIELATN